MYLSDYSRYVSQGRKASARMRRRGINPRGDRLWSDEEDATCRELYPDYQALAGALPHRTMEALKTRCRSLGIARKVHIWTAKERSDFRRLYATADREEVLRRFPHLNVDSFHTYGQRLRVQRPKAPPALTGNYLLDELRQRARDEGLTMPDLDEFAGSREYFKCKRWRPGRGRIKYDFIVRAIHELGGRLQIVWSDQ